MIKHTPGPWKVDEFGYINAGGQQIADVYVYDSSDCMDCGQCEAHSVRDEPKLPYKANARLIVAAPELLEAIKESMWYIDFGDSGANEWYEKTKELIAKIERD